MANLPPGATARPKTCRQPARLIPQLQTPRILSEAERVHRLGVRVLGELSFEIAAGPVSYLHPQTAKPKILRKVEWDMPLICVMAEIWADSLAHLSKTATPATSAAAPASASSEARDGTDAPAREPAPPRAVPNRPTRKVARQQSQQLKRSARTFRGQPVGNFIESPDHV